MSDDWLIIIPTDPLILPPAERREAAFNLLCSLRPDAQDAELIVSELPAFFDCGGNFDGVFCPFCATDLLPWWPDQMDKWWEGGRRTFAVATPCCDRTTTMNDLDYQLPQGFACVGFQLMNVWPDLDSSEREQIETALGTPVRSIWRHI